LITPDTVPVKSATGSHEEESSVILSMPRYPTPAGRLMGKLLRRSKHIKVRLDSLGSAVWRLIDGTKSVRQISEEMRNVFGDAAEPVYPRLMEFLVILHKNKFIRLTEPCEVKNVD
jgi:hypothetical protein